MSVYFECPVCGKQPKIGTYGVNIAWASCKGYAFHRHKKISVCIFDQPSTLFQSLRSHWNQIQFREARFLYFSEEEVQRLTGDKMIPKEGTIIPAEEGET